MSDRYAKWVQTKFNGDFDQAKEYMRQLGSNGGKKCAQKYGRDHYVKLGKLGFQALVRNKRDEKDPG